ncbi:fumarylacetoacetate hydrolase family protein [Paludifilum halophilum]|uniref:2-hydroxyhepta-2,4-diene-1,7-dioate isomerase n=1 Tax=Paludifilum halophilum TaxID=1642702 RepID=A0A235B684_9BACL|nr:fumarylacetoacetate hydrolase family protein [Paludifilum halophilum]OYD07818.1 hypothetical protein CHM34_10195 [Paludifilum halophilum]
MKILRYRYRNRVEWGIWKDEGIQPVRGDLFGSLEEQGEVLSPSRVEYMSPLRPNKLIAIGRNYVDHAKEMGNAVPEEPMMFLVSPTAVIGSGEAIHLPNRIDSIEFEAELAVVIGEEGRNIPAGRASEHILGYTCGIDVSNRVLQKKDGQFTRAKSFDTFKPLGPMIETDMDSSDRWIRLKVNGEIRQDGRTSDMVHSVPALVEAISHVFPLERGDVILTGTPAGVGRLFPGDQVEMEIEGIGTLSHRVEG